MFQVLKEAGSPAPAGQMTVTRSEGRDGGATARDRRARRAVATARDRRTDRRWPARDPRYATEGHADMYQLTRWGREVRVHGGRARSLLTARRGEQFVEYRADRALDVGQGGLDVVDLGAIRPGASIERPARRCLLDRVVADVAVVDVQGHPVIDREVAPIDHRHDVALLDRAVARSAHYVARPIRPLRARPAASELTTALFSVHQRRR